MTRSLLARLRRGSLPLLALFALSAGPASAQLAGLVYDGNDGTPLAGVTVVVLDEAFKPLASVASDAVGRFELRADGGAWVAAERSGWAGVPVELAEVGALDELLLPLFPATVEDEPTEEVIETARTDGGELALVFGYVSDATTGNPISGASVELVERDQRTISGASGRFAIDLVEPGVVIARVRMLGYETREIAVPIGSGSAFELQVPLATEAIELEGIEVTATSRFVARRLLSAYHRADKAPLGRYVMKEEIEERAYPPIEQILRGKQSIRLTRGGPTGATFQMRIRGCAPSLWVDGMQVARAGDDDTLSEYLRWPSYDIEMIEVFPGPASLPAEFDVPGTMCAIAMWTRRGE